jgi:putative nucleotide binding protein
MNNNNKKERAPAVKKEENAVILDYLSRGYVKSDMSKFGGKAIAQAIGTEQFTLLELAPKTGVDLEIQDTVYIGKGKRDKIYRVLGKLNFENLTATSRIELEYAIRDIVEANEQKYVDFFKNLVYHYT